MYNVFSIGNKAIISGHSTTVVHLLDIVSQFCTEHPEHGLSAEIKEAADSGCTELLARRGLDAEGLPIKRKVTSWSR